MIRRAVVWYFTRPLVIAACEKDISELPRLFLAWLSDRLPARYIKHEGRPYLERYFLAHLFGLRVYLHHFVGSDPDGMHDHPWRYSLSIILCGWYMEQRRDGWRVRAWLNWITGDTFHRVVLPEGSQGVWSIFIHGGRVKPWGFLREYEHWSFGCTPGRIRRKPFFIFEAAGDGDKPHSDWHKRAPKGRELRMQHADLRVSDADAMPAAFRPHNRRVA